MKLLSIIIPIYNLEDYIETCLESIVSQVKDDIEILLIDDGSTDSSKQICELFLKKYSYIKYFYQKNSGVSVARNVGLDKASGEYIMFVDGDDWFLPNTISKIVAKIKDKSFDMIIGGYVESCKNVSTYKNYSDELINYIEKEKYPNNAIKIFSDNVYIPALWGNIFRKSILKDNKIKLISNVKYTEDMDCCLKIFLASRKIGILDFPFYVYRVSRNGSATSTWSEKRVSDVLNFVINWSDFFENVNNDSDLKQEIMNFIAYEYVIALGLLYTISSKQRNKFKKKFKKYRCILKGKKNKKVLISNCLIYVLGLNFTGYLLSRFIMLKNR